METTTARRPHRPYGSGSHIVRLERRTDQDGARLFIGRALWQALGQPPSVSLDRDAAGRLIIRPGADHAVAGQRSNGMPRAAVSLRRLADLNLTASGDDWPAHVVEGAIICDHA